MWENKTSNELTGITSTNYIMPLTKEYKNYLFVTVKPGWTDFKIYSGNQLQYLIHGRAEGGAACYTLQLNAGSWQIIGKGDAIDWEGIVEMDDPHPFYKNYADSFGMMTTALDSGISLLASLKMEPQTTLVLKKN